MFFTQLKSRISALPGVLNPIGFGVLVSAALCLAVLTGFSLFGRLPWPDVIVGYGVVQYQIGPGIQIGGTLFLAILHLVPQGAGAVNMRYAIILWGADEGASDQPR